MRRPNQVAYSKPATYVKHRARAKPPGLGEGKDGRDEHNAWVANHDRRHVVEIEGVAGHAVDKCSGRGRESLTRAKHGSNTLRALSECKFQSDSGGCGRCPRNDAGQAIEHRHAGDFARTRCRLQRMQRDQPRRAGAVRAFVIVSHGAHPTRIAQTSGNAADNVSFPCPLRFIFIVRRGIARRRGLMKIIGT